MPTIHFEFKVQSHSLTQKFYYDFLKLLWFYNHYDFIKITLNKRKDI